VTCNRTLNHYCYITLHLHFVHVISNVTVYIVFHSDQWIQ